ncbi:MAG: chromosome partitioning protein ParB [Nocardioidaceae bacterium]
MPRDTGFPLTDAQFDFSRARRRAALSRLAGVLRRDGDVDVMLPFEEVVQALGRRGERYLGLRSIRLDSIVGTVDRGREFDRKFRPRSGRVRPRWERIAEAQRRGESMPPIDVYRVSDLHFVKDGHHRVSVARALGHTHIDAYVTEVETVVGAGGGLRLRELALKSYERIFRERVPLPAEAYARIELREESRYAALAEGVEAWGFRVMQDQGELLTRERIAELWFHEEYEPVVEMLREADLIGGGTSAEAYMRVAEQRYLLLRTHVWDDDVIERLREALG